VDCRHWCDDCADFEWVAEFESKLGQHAAAADSGRANSRIIAGNFFKKKSQKISQFQKLFFRREKSKIRREF